MVAKEEVKVDMSYDMFMQTFTQHMNGTANNLRTPHLSVACLPILTTADGTIDENDVSDDSEDS